VIDRGKVVETGDHDGLVAAGGLYARLAQTQNLDRVQPDPKGAA
jgi:ABC-type multidrug transport system fused ATPase/permease subunit